MKKVIGKSSLSYEELGTVLVEVENVLNNRPLTYVDTDVTEEVVTPNRLLCGKNLSVVSQENGGSMAVNNVMLKKRCVYRQKVLRDFRSRWEIEYLSYLRDKQRMPNSKLSRVPCAGDVVLVHGDTPRLSWRLGRVLSLIPSDDGVVRGVFLRLSGTGNVVKRSVRCLYPLEIGSDVEDPILPPVDNCPARSKISSRGGCNDLEKNNIPIQCKLEHSSELREGIVDTLPSLPSTSETKPRRAAAVASDIKRRLLNKI